MDVFLVQVVGSFFHDNVVVNEVVLELIVGMSRIIFPIMPVGSLMMVGSSVLSPIISSLSGVRPGSTSADDIIVGCGCWRVNARWGTWAGAALFAPVI